MQPELIDDVHALNGKSHADGASRRTALKLALGAGYAAAAPPLMAQTAITTPSDGLDAGTITFSAAGVSVPAYMAKPKGKTNLPVVLVVQEIFGVHAYIADTCRRLAHLGYLAIAPDLYFRQGNPREYTDTPKLMSEVVSKVPDPQVMADLDAVLVWAHYLAVRSHGQGQGRRGLVWPAGGSKTELTPQQPVDVAAQLKAPVLGLYASNDKGIPLDTVETMRKALAAAAEGGHAAAKASRIDVFEGTEHGFHADYRPMYSKVAPESGWQRMLDWFKAHGVAPS